VRSPALPPRSGHRDAPRGPILPSLAAIALMAPDLPDDVRAPARDARKDEE
jgi:hypothetical protein